MNSAVDRPERRPLGSTGFMASRLGIGDLADRSLTLKECVRLARRAMDEGLNLIDTAPGYEDGFSEEIVGTAVREQGERDSLFVISKIDFPDRPVAGQVNESLERMGLAYADLFVLHGCSSAEAWSQAAAPGGSMHRLGEVIRAGKCRFRGISSHNPEVLLQALRSGLCDVVMFAVGPFCDPRYTSEVLPEARKRGVGTVCFKTFGAGKLLWDTSGYGVPAGPAKAPPASVADKGKLDTGAGEGSNHGQPRHLPHLSVEECLHYTLTYDPDVALLGLSSAAEQDAAFAAWRSFKAPLTPQALCAVEKRAASAVADKGPCWWDPPAKLR